MSVTCLILCITVKGIVGNQAFFEGIGCRLGRLIFIHSRGNEFQRIDNSALKLDLVLENSFVFVDDLIGGGFLGAIRISCLCVVYLFFRVVAFTGDCLGKALPLAAQDENALFCIVFLVPGKGNFLSVYREVASCQG